MTQALSRAGFEPALPDELHPTNSHNYSDSPVPHSIHFSRIVRRNSLIDRNFLREEEHLSPVLWNFCRPVHCASSALLAICLLEQLEVPPPHSLPHPGERFVAIEIPCWRGWLTKPTYQIDSPSTLYLSSLQTLNLNPGLRGLTTGFPSLTS